MVKKFPLVLVIILFLTSCQNNSINKTDLEKAIESRISILKSDWRHEALSLYQLTIPVDSVISKFEYYQNLNSQDLERELQLWANELEIDIIKTNDIQSSILLNQLIILDKLIFDSRLTTNSFGQLKAEVAILNETDEKYLFGFFLTAVDSLFLPSVQLYNQSDTFIFLLTKKEV